MKTIAAGDDSLGPTRERFGFTMFMSLCVHAVLILGLGFSIATERQPATQIAVTLAQYRSAQAPPDADFIAQANQLGSGSEAETLAPATPIEARFAASEIRAVAHYPAAPPAVPREGPSDPLLATTNPDAMAQSPQQAQVETQPADPGRMSAAELHAATSSLQAQLDLHRQEYAKRPRRYTISSASTKEDRDARYLDSWRKRIEAVGNQHYPSQASQEGIYGTLRLLVALNPDGSVEDIRILRSSGAQVLDAAAVRIVQLAAPFEPFPPEMRAQVDVLEIIRTWQFHQGARFSSF